MYSVKIFDHCPEFGGETILLDFATREDAQRVAEREKAEAMQYGLIVSVTVIKNA
jgi:hypothetical protein